MFEETHETPFGWLTVFSDGEGVTRLTWSEHGMNDDSKADYVSRETWRQINEYCQGRRRHFDIPLTPKVSPEMKRWLEVMRDIKCGTTVTYKDFAEMWGNIEAARAAGQACSNNPIPLINPCHRVTQIDGTLGNYGVLDGLEYNDPRNLAIKQALIDHEKAMTQ